MLELRQVDYHKVLYSLSGSQRLQQTGPPPLLSEPQGLHAHSNMKLGVHLQSVRLLKTR